MAPVSTHLYINVYTVIIHQAKTKSKYNVTHQSHYLTKIENLCADLGLPEHCGIFQRLKTVDLQHNRQLVSTSANG